MNVLKKGCAQKIFLVSFIMLFSFSVYSNSKLDDLCFRGAFISRIALLGYKWATFIPQLVPKKDIENNGSSDLSPRALQWVHAIFKERGLSDAMVDKIKYQEGVLSKSMPIGCLVTDDHIYLQLCPGDRKFLNEVLQKEYLSEHDRFGLAILCFIIGHEAGHLKKKESAPQTSSIERFFKVTGSAFLSWVSYEACRFSGLNSYLSFAIAESIMIFENQLFVQNAIDEECYCDALASDDPEIIRAGIYSIETHVADRAKDYLYTILKNKKISDYIYKNHRRLVATLTHYPHPIDRADKLRKRLYEIEQASFK